MLRNHLKTALRNLWKNSFFSLLNILGLAVGLAAFLLILLYVNIEWSYDQFHTDSEQLYRVQLNQYQDGELLFASSENYPGVGPALKAELPEVLEYARLYNLGAKNNMVVTWDDAPNGPIQFKHRRLLYADSTFLTMFSYPWVAGNPETALEAPYSMVISESFAKKYFGEEEALGKMLHMKDDDYNDELCKVTGVFKDVPLNTHLKFDILISYNTLYARGEWAPGRYHASWGRKDMYTYIKVRPGTDIAALEAKFPPIIEKNNPELSERNRKDELLLQPVTDIHLYSDLTDEPEANGNGQFVSFMLLIALFILLIAYINYINLATARSLERANEVGVRKVLGAYRSQLVRQFLLESTIVNIVSLVLAMILVEVALPFFNQLTGQAIPAFGIWQTVWFVPVIIGLLMAGSLLSGLYPSFVLSSFRPVEVLNSKYGNAGKGAFLRKMLVVFQFGASVFLIIGTFIVYQQMDFMLNQDLGFNPKQTLVVERPGISARDRQLRGQQIDSFTEQADQHAAINKVTRSSTLLGKKMRFKTDVHKYSEPENTGVTFTFSGIDYDFLEAMEMKVIAGRNFSKDFTTDIDTACMLTVSGAKALGFENPEDALNQSLSIPRFRWNAIVVGVVNDYHQESLKLEMNPTLFYPTLHGAEYYLMKVNTADIPGVISHLEKTWEAAFPGNPFEYFFLDDYFNKQYKNEQRFGRLFAVFAILAIMVGCLGLFGLSAFTAQRRTKEIGIRKVLGASVRDILVLLSKDFMVLILLANIIAWPIVWVIMRKWLDIFAYRIEIPWMMFLLAGIVVVVIALVTISLQAYKAATSNPVTALRAE